MTEMSEQPIVVGVSKPGESENALRFAVDEALLQRCRLTIVHALSDSLGPPPGDPLIDFGERQERSHHFVDQNASADAYRLVTDIARRARAMSNDQIEVDTDVPVGRRVHAIVEAGKTARLVVLQHRDLSMIEKIFDRSTTVGVSGRARCSVVTVRPSWEPDLRHNRITTGIGDLENSDDILRVAFESASRRKATLQIVHAWNLMSAEGDVSLSRTMAEEWKSQSELAMAELLLPWQRQFSQVKIEQRVVEQGVTEALLQYSKESDLLVLGRLRAALPLPLPLGSVGRAMVNGSQCPVEIVPHFTGKKEVPGSGHGFHERFDRVVWAD